MAAMAAMAGGDGWAAVPFGPGFYCSLSSGLLDLNAAAELFQHVFASVMVDDEHAVFLVRPLVPLEHRHGWRGARDVWQRNCDLIAFAHLQLPSQEVSIDAGLKS